MSQVYVIDENSKTLPMERVRCKDEDKELQQLLEQNYDLLPGDEIKPDDPRRWLLVRREMPVADPSSGSSRWSVDFFFADQSGIPTFVECKRFMNTQSRREVVGQMLEYAANGHHYWTTDTLRRYAAETAERQGIDLDEAIRVLDPDDTDLTDGYIERIVHNLREGQVRLVFFLEEAPQELRSIVDFLNRQMERSEVLIVEAKQYKMNGVRVVAPSLFGYTEEARQIKRSVTVVTGRRKIWTEEAFYEDACERLSQTEFGAVKRLINFLKSHDFKEKCGTGTEIGSINFRLPNLQSKSVMTVYSDGRVVFPFGGLNGDERVERFRDDLAEVVSTEVGLAVPEDYRQRYPSTKVADWGKNVEKLVEVLADLFVQHMILESAE